MPTVSGYICVCVFCVLYVCLRVFNMLMVLSNSLLLSSVLTCCLVSRLSDCSKEPGFRPALSRPSSRLMYSVWVFGTCLFGRS